MSVASGTDSFTKRQIYALPRSESALIHSQSFWPSATGSWCYTTTNLFLYFRSISNGSPSSQSVMVVSRRDLATRRKSQHARFTNTRGEFRAKGSFVELRSWRRNTGCEHHPCRRREKERERERERGYVGVCVDVK